MVGMHMTENKFTVLMDLNNIGPHHGAHKISFSETVDSNKTIIYAANGTGKSFVSRAFRLSAPSKADMIADEMLTIGEQNGHFSFEIQNDDVDKKLDIIIQRGKPTVVKNSSGLLFHVFNNDYVEENIKAKDYSLDGKIEGYILGRIQIDLTEERRNAEVLEGEIDRENVAIDTAIDEAKAFLKNNGVVSTTTEFSAITRHNVENGFGYEIAESVDECVQRIKTLESIPEDIPDIRFSIPLVDLAFLDELETVLKSVYPKSEWDEEFVREYKDQQSFIETGLDYDQADKKCPFCKREYDAEALNLINQYNQYRNDQEAQVVGQLQGLLQAVNLMAGKLYEENQRIDIAEAQLVKVQKYFPSLATSKLQRITRIDNHKAVFMSLSEMTSRKIDSLSLVLENVENTINDCRQVWAEIIELQKNNQNIVDTANKTKNDAKTERLSLRKDLCKAKSVALQRELSDNFNSINEKKAKLKDLQDEITKKEQQAKASKRDKVYETLESSLNRFFNGKYQIDEESFQITFHGNTVGDNASRILSDGEKSIVAFCWYLAETHTIINSEDDYNKLFFVIDDPVSSMDFQYVYAVAQAIRDIKSVFGISGHERIWIFTHNNEFFSIVMRNHILKNAYIMKPGSIQPYNHQLLMPYESHLSDLIAIANGSELPNHTTGNSIRHVIETIAKFENPQIRLETYINNEDLLSKDSCIFSLCQDLSHGNIRKEVPYSEDVLKEAAKKVIEFIRVKYPGQLKE